MNHNSWKSVSPGDDRVTILRPDLRKTESALAALGIYDFGARTFDDRHHDPRLAVKTHGPLHGGVRLCSDPKKNGRPCNTARLLTFMQSKGAGAFFVVNALDGLGQRKDNVIGIRALFVDCDDRLQVERLQTFIAETGLTPTMIVASGGVHDGVDKLQVYWRMTGCAVEDFMRYQPALISRIGSDPAVRDASRVMRLPGFYHQKREPRMTRILEISGAEYHVGTFIPRVLAYPQFCDPSRGISRARTYRDRVGHPIDTAGPTARLRVLLDLHGGLIVPAVHALIREARAPSQGAGGNRYPTLLSIVARCAQCGWRDEGIRKLVLPVASEAWDATDIPEQLEGIVRWVREQEAAKLAAAPMSDRARRIAAAFGGKAGGQ